MTNNRSGLLSNRAVLPAALVVNALFMTASITPAQAASQADQVRAFNGQLLRLQAENRRSPNGSANLKAADLIATRAAALRALIVTSPTDAEALAFPASVLDQLADTFPAQSANLEERGNWNGTLEVRIEDDVALKRHRAIYRLHRASEILDVKFSGREPPGLRTGMKVSLRGVRSGEAVAITEIELQEAAVDGSASATSTENATTAGAQCGPSGAQSIASVLVNLPNYSLPGAATPDFVRGVLLGNAAGGAQSSPDWSVNDFWTQNSDGKTTVDAASSTVIGPIVLSRNYNTSSAGATSCDVYGIQDEVIKVLDGQLDLRRYSRIQIIMPPNGACGWAGTAYVGCQSFTATRAGTFSASVAWQRADTMQSRGSAVQLSTHEMGHNLGMMHSSSRDHGSQTLGALSDAGSIAEYGDTHSTMGSWNFGFYNASHAANQLGWLASGSGYQQVESSGTYTISNYESRGGGLKALKVRRGTGNSAWLWIESRQNTGIYSSQLSSQLFGGALIHYQDSTTGYRSHLVDFIAGTDTFADAALPVGGTWTDPYSNVSITVNSVTPGAMTVSVNYGGVTCTPTDPAITVAPTGVSTAYGSAAQFNVTVKNNSSSGCASETINLAADVPSGWAAAFGTSSMVVGPGGQASTILNVNVPAPYALGTYAVTSRANSTTGKISTDVDNVTVVEPTNRLSVSISGTGSVAFSVPAKTCSTSCAADYTGTATVVTLIASTDSRNSFAGWTGACAGTAKNCTLTMDSAKSVSAVFKRVKGKR